MKLPVSAGSLSCIFPERLDKMAFTGKAQSRADLGNRMIGVNQHGPGCFQSFFLYIGQRSHSCFLPEEMGESSAAQPGGISQLGEGDLFLNMAADIADGSADCLGIRGRLLFMYV